MKSKILLLALVGITILSCNQDTDSSNNNENSNTTTAVNADKTTSGSADAVAQIYKNISLDEFANKINKSKNAVLIDVRTNKEFWSGSIENSVNYDYYSTDFMDNLSKHDKSQPLLLYCAKGSRGDGAMKLARDNGFKEVYNLEGGIAAWHKAGKKTVR